MSNEKIARLWAKYLDYTKRYTKKPQVAKWFLKHAEAYIQAHAGQRLSTHTAQHVRDYLAEKGRIATLKLA